MGKAKTGNTEPKGKPRLDSRFVASVAERDVDFVLLEEFTVNPEFGDFVTSRVSEKPVFQSVIDAWHSLAKTEHGDGESDLLFVFQSSEGQRVALLIENKIDAVPQPRQAERYRERGAKGVTDGYWDAFQTVLFVPRKYLEGRSQDAEKYDCTLAYEEILSFFVSRRSRDPRFGYKARIIQEAIEQNRRGYQPVISAAMTAFVKDYCAFANREAPDPHVEEAKPRPAGSNWILFRPHGVPPRGASLYHQLSVGRVKLIFAGRAADQDKWLAEWSAKVPPEVELEKAGKKSMAMSITVPEIDPLGRPFAEQESAVRAALSAVRTLWKTAEGRGAAGAG